MKTGRDRFGPVTFLVMAALLLFALFSTPGVQRVDTGPQLIALELVSHPAAEVVLPAVFVDMVDQAEGLNVYFAENELRVEMKTALASPAEVARYESGHRSGVGKRSLAITGYDVDLTRIARGGGLASPLRI